MVSLSHGFAFKTLQILLLDKTVFQESVRREQCPPCAQVTQMERRTDIYTIPKLNEKEDN